MTKPFFTAFTRKYNGIVNRIISETGLTPAFDPSKLADNKIPFEIIEKKALWDTGATNSVITPDTAKDLNLTPIGVREVRHFGGTKVCNTYLVNFFLPNQVIISGVSVTESDSIINDFGIIIGMDIISKGDFSITNVGGSTWVSYRVPSITQIDYVIEARRIKYAKVDKYGPCPCGKKDENGRPVKFKFCHGKDL